jgi:hypothetical protein
MPSRKKTRASRHNVVLELERLEDRFCPSNYIWTNGLGNGTWELAGNWRSTDGGTKYPGATPGDVANLNGATDSNTSITMTKAETISSLNITSWGGGTPRSPSRSTRHLR